MWFAYSICMTQQRALHESQVLLDVLTADMSQVIN
jgi:hypothetical protein